MARIAQEMEMKYKNRKIKTADGVFDSAKEYYRWIELKNLARSGTITKLKRQVPYVLIESQKGSVRTERPVKYVADFVYDMDGVTIVEDVKGLRTRDYIIKRKLMLKVHGIEIREV